jgi:hypothetical protein
MTPTTTERTPNPQKPVAAKLASRPVAETLAKRLNDATARKMAERARKRTNRRVTAGSAAGIFGWPIASATAPTRLKIPPAAEQTRTKSVGVPFDSAATHAATMPVNDAILLC